MVMKRSRPEVSAPKAPPTKKPRVDPGLAKIWEGLADDDEAIRLDSAFDLINNYCKSDEIEHARTIAKRLFRGLCSSRKGARPGFYVALVGALSMKSGPFGQVQLSVQEVLSILESQTGPEPDTTGQDERDHHFGRLLACKAVLESEILSKSGALFDASVERTLQTICVMMAQKPWLRNEASTIICVWLSSLAQSQDYTTTTTQSAVDQVFNQLKANRLLKTVDGTNIWLHVQSSLPNAKLPRGVWTGENPLSAKELPNLKKALLDSRGSNNTDHDEVLGTSGWSPKLHGVWSKVIQKLQPPVPKGQVSFSHFWDEVVDDGLFNPSSTPERKFVGFLVLENALLVVEIDQLRKCFSKNLMVCMLHALKSGDDAYLQQVARRVFETVRMSINENDTTRMGRIVEGLMIGCGFADFDTIAKTNIVASLLEKTNFVPDKGIGNTLLMWLSGAKVNGTAPHDWVGKRNVLRIVQRSLCQMIRSHRDDSSDDVDDSKRGIRQSEKFLKLLMGLQYQHVSDPVYGEILKDTLLQVMEVFLSNGIAGQLSVLETLSAQSVSDLAAEDRIKALFTESRHLLNTLLQPIRKELSGSRQTHGRKATATPRYGMALLLAVLLHDIHNGNVDSIEMLEDVKDMAIEVQSARDDKRVADHVIDIIMSLMSKPSKFYRRVSELVFESFACEMSDQGLEVLCDILTSREGREGQQELFENDDIEFDGDEESEPDEGFLDSDVETVEPNGIKHDSSSEQSGSTDGSEDDEPSSEAKSSDEQDDELISFERDLAAALGTRKLTEDDVNAGSNDSSDDDSDLDMSDSEMIDLDEKLAEVFRNKQSQVSAQKLRREEAKIAKDNVINLKNRALDLVGLFLRQQQTRGIECVLLLSATLQMARNTSSHQLAHRGTEMVKSYLHKSKAAKMPKVPREKASREALEKHLTDVHFLIAQKEVNNAVIEVAGQFHILLCRLLTQASTKDIREIVAAAAEETHSKSDMNRKAIQQFWSRFEAWADALQEKEAAGSRADSALNGDTSETMITASKSSSRKGKKT